jgi:NADH dehydrogenase
MAVPHVVIVGAGFGGLTAALQLARSPVRITVIDRHNYHLFQPLLYQVATAALSPADVAEPIRSILAHQPNAEMVLGEVIDIDLDGKRVLLRESAIPFDYLIVASGARHSYFGHNQWALHAPALKSIEDALNIRRALLLAFERAEQEPDPAVKQALMTFIVIGGGPTGVELAGAIAELARHTLIHDFRHIDTRRTRVLLVEGGARILNSFPERLSKVAKRSLEKLGVEVLLGRPVDGIDAKGILLGGERILSSTVLWAAGVGASPAAQWLKVEPDRAGRVIVTEYLTLPGRDDILVIGDTAKFPTADGYGLPGVAPVAKQQGAYAGRYVAARLAGKALTKPFHYKNQGNLATIGRNHAVADFGWLRVTGFPGWFLWSAAHVFFLIGFRNRILVSIQWLWIYFTGKRSARLITGRGGEG